MSWLNELMVSTEELESPRSFWWWSGLCAISAVVKDNVWVNRGNAYRLYPNIYVMLYARSGLRKGLPINLAKRMVGIVNNTKIISGRSSIQGILGALSKAQSLPGGKISAQAKAFIVASEISASLVEDPAAMNILTDLFDRIYNSGDWSNLLKSEKFDLKDPCITMLGGINEAHWNALFKDKDLMGGYVGRNFVISETKKHRSNSLIKKLVNPPDPDKLAVYLKKVSLQNGEFKDLDNTHAGSLYDSWYSELDKAIEEHEIEDKTGTLDRIGDAVMKVAMLLSLADSISLEISERNMQEAIEKCEVLVGAVRKTTLGQGGRGANSANKALIINEILKREDLQVSRKFLLKKLWMHFEFEELDTMMSSLEQAGIVKLETSGNQIYYRMPVSQADELRQIIQEKKK